MLFYTHIGSSILLSAVVFILFSFVSSLRRCRNLMSFFLAGSVGVQFIDLDHYAGSVNDLVSCGLAYNYQDFISNRCGVLLERGMFHQPLFIYLAVPILSLFLLNAYFKNNWRDVLFILGIMCGYLLHLYLDLC